MDNQFSEYDNMAEIDQILNKVKDAQFKAQDFYLQLLIVYQITNGGYDEALIHTTLTAIDQRHTQEQSNAVVALAIYLHKLENIQYVSGDICYKSRDYKLRRKDSKQNKHRRAYSCLLYTSDAADE